MSKQKKAKCCNNCIRGIQVNLTTDILCKVNGVVTYDYVCTKYKSKPLPELEPGQKYKCRDCEFFIESDETASQSEASQSEYTGFCQLFTVRHFNGAQKNACSRFCKKAVRIVS